MGISNSNISKIFLFLIIILLPLFLGAQYYNKQKQNFGFSDGWSVDLNIGLTSFFGDLSVFDFDILKKFSKESKLGAGIIFAKGISPVVTFNTQLLYGSLTGTKKSSNIYFNCNIFEGSLNLQINFSQIISPRNSRRKINIFGNFGTGLVSIRSKLYDLTTDSLIHSFGFGRKTIESILQFGFKINYVVNDQYDLNFTFTNRRVDTDKLDSQAGNENKDFYSYISVGVTYKFKSYNKRSFKYRKSKKPFKRKFPKKKRLKRKWKI